MATITTVRHQDENTGKVYTPIKFIPLELATFEGSAGFGGVPVSDPVQAAKDWAEANGHTGENDNIVILDTQTPEWAGNKTVLLPEYKESNDWALTWHTC